MKNDLLLQDSVQTIYEVAARFREPLYSTQVPMILQQMQAKGIITREELLQLDKYIPGTFRYAVNAMHITPDELQPMLESRNIQYADFLPRFALAIAQNFIC